MAKEKANPVYEADEAARTLARELLAKARFGALAVIDPRSGAPYVSRVALGVDEEGCPVTLVSDLALHSQALRLDPRGGLLVGEPGPRGDPLTHPRLSLTVHTRPVAAEDRSALRSLWLRNHPKSKLYVDFADFNFLRLEPVNAMLNAGFGKAYALGANDLRLPSKGSIS